MAEKLIRRYEHNYFRGWAFATKRRGRKWVKYFSDKPHGRAAALRRAREYRDALLMQLPRPTKLKSRFVRNTTGVIGVARARERSRSGSISERYVATWPTRTGRSGKASFSVQLYGESAARRYAIEARRRGVAEYLGLDRRAVGESRGRPTRGADGATA
jgi:hypothetical protein